MNNLGFSVVPYDRIDGVEDEAREEGFGGMREDEVGSRLDNHDGQRNRGDVLLGAR